MRPVRTAETFAGGSVVLLEETRERWVGQQAECVAVGAPALCEDPDCDRQHGYSPQRPPSLFAGAGPQGARALAAGWLPPTDPDCLWFHPAEVKAGDWLLVEPRHFTEITDGLWALPQESVLAVLSA